MLKDLSIEVKNLVKEFPNLDGHGSFFAVNGVNIEVPKGSFVTLLGPSGCGKTTILRMIAGFETATSGDIFLNGTRINSVTPDKRDTAMVFQSYALFPHYNVFDNVAYGLENKKLSKEEIKSKVMHMLDLVGLNGLENRSTNQLSGGQQQRVALARALVMEPSVLLFDEPLSNLDAKLRVYMRKEIRKIQQSVGITSIYVTHDQSEAMALSDIIIIMNKGNIEQIGTPQEVYQHPANRFVADFIGSSNFVPAKVLNSQGESVEIDLLGQTLTLAANHQSFTEGEMVDIVVRPEGVRLSDQGEVEAEVTSSVYMGHYQEYAVRSQDVELNLEAYDPAGSKIYQAGERVYLQFKPQNLHPIKSKEV
ncbi:ABC transporter ATP-binding protein [Selenomonas sp. TAMA-11512]|uniref:ABC transporter ATP-binding protein n=1 Tax=Selenomonas sp. TAMA-11512 TaxID=3095337 RepID=UPI00308C73ED|nr:ABC transporter ATP-binding protein [Selenomonas sp. TAMA-11512]